MSEYIQILEIKHISRTYFQEDFILNKTFINHAFDPKENSILKDLQSKIILSYNYSFSSTIRNKIHKWPAIINYT